MTDRLRLNCGEAFERWLRRNAHTVTRWCGCGPCQVRRVKGVEVVAGWLETREGDGEDEPQVHEDEGREGGR